MGYDDDLMIGTEDFYKDLPLNGNDRMNLNLNYDQNKSF
jgi:hypothetical protein